MDLDTKEYTKWIVDYIWTFEKHVKTPLIKYAPFGPKKQHLIKDCSYNQRVEHIKELSTLFKISK